MVRQYETTFIVDAHLPTEQIDKSIEKITAFIEKHKGKVKDVNRWGKRRLAYEISKKQYGYYVYVRFEAEGTFIIEFENEFKLDSSVLRMLTVLIPKSVLKTEKLGEDSKEKPSKEVPQEEEIEEKTESKDEKTPDEEIQKETIDKDEKESEETKETDKETEKKTEEEAQEKTKEKTEEIEKKEETVEEDPSSSEQPEQND